MPESSGCGNDTRLKEHAAWSDKDSTTHGVRELVGVGDEAFVPPPSEAVAHPWASTLVPLCAEGEIADADLDESVAADEDEGSE